MQIEICSLSDVGRRREHNEDNYVVCGDLSLNKWEKPSGQSAKVITKGSILFVADGMGGTNAGEIASAIAKETIENEFNKFNRDTNNSEEDILKGAILKAHANIILKEEDDATTKGMGTTATIAWIKNDKVHVAWSGDSRAYLIRKGAPAKPLTNDHSLVWDLVLNGILTADEARNHPQSNVITQSLGGTKPPQPDYLQADLKKDDVILLCSDGLNGMMSDEEIFNIVLSSSSLSDIAQDLINTANQYGGKDNITVVMVRVAETETALPTGLQKKPSKRKVFSFASVAIIVVLLVLTFWFTGLLPWAKPNKANDTVINPNKSKPKQASPITPTNLNKFKKDKDSLNSFNGSDLNRSPLLDTASKKSLNSEKELGKEKYEPKIIKPILEEKVKKVEPKLKIPARDSDKRILDSQKKVEIKQKDSLKPKPDTVRKK